MLLCVNHDTLSHIAAELATVARAALTCEAADTGPMQQQLRRLTQALSHHDDLAVATQSGVHRASAAVEGRVRLGLAQAIGTAVATHEPRLLAMRALSLALLVETYLELERSSLFHHARGGRDTART